MIIRERRQIRRMTANRSGESQKPKLVPIPRDGIKGVPGIILHVLLALASIMIPIGIDSLRYAPVLPEDVMDVLSLAVIIILGFSLLRICSSMRGFIPLVLISGAFLVFLGIPLPIIAMLLSFLYVIGAGALLLSVTSRQQAPFFPLVLLGAYAVSLVVCRDAVFALLCLLPYPAAAALALGTRSSAAKEDGLTRVGVICATSLALGLSITLAAYVALDRMLGGLTLNALHEWIEGIRTSLISMLVSLKDTLPEGTLATDALDTETVTNIVNSALNILPGALVVALNVAVTLSQLILHAALTTFGHGASLTERVRVFRMSIVSAVIFLLGYIVALVASGGGSSTLVGVVAENLVTILQPGLALCGLLRLVAGFGRRVASGRGGCIVFLLIIPCLFLSVPVVLAIYESISSVIAPILARKKKPEDPDRQP